MFKNNLIFTIFSTSFAACVYAQQPPLEAPLPAWDQPSVNSQSDDSRPSSPAISVDELLRSGQLRRVDVNRARSVVPAPSVPPSYSGVAYQSALGPGLASSDPVLLSIFKFAGNTQAQIEIGLNHRIVRTGDRLKDGWIVKAISTNSVSMERCEKKRCRHKKIHLGDD